MSALEKSLDEILADRRTSQPHRRRGGGRDNRNRGGSGVSKPQRYDTNAHWVHDKFESTLNDRRDREDRRQPRQTESSAKLKVENLHYDLTQDDLMTLFERVGPVKNISLKYDRAGRSEGIAFVTYEKIGDAEAAIRQYDGELALGQPIRLSFVGPPPGRSLADRISLPVQKKEPMPLSREKADRIDRYVPGGESGRSDERRNAGDRRRNDRPRVDRERGERGEQRGERRGGRARGGAGSGGGRGGRQARPKKTAEDLDAEMDDYFASAQNGDATAPADAAAAPAVAAPAAAQDMDAEMAE